MCVPCEAVCSHELLTCGSTATRPRRRVILRVLRNEIYARHGRIFTSPDIIRIFDSVPWYKPKPEFNESDLNDIEKKNVNFILDFEKKKGWN